VVPHLKSLIRMAQETDSHDIVIEIFGILSNMTSLDLPANQTWEKFLREYNLLSLLSKFLVPGMCQNDMLLEVILVISTAASEQKVCELLATSKNIIGLLYQVEDVLFPQYYIKNMIVLIIIMMVIVINPSVCTTTARSYYLTITMLHCSISYCSTVLSHTVPYRTVLPIGVAGEGG